MLESFECLERHVAVFWASRDWSAQPKFANQMAVRTTMVVIRMAQDRKLKDKQKMMSRCNSRNDLGCPEERGYIVSSIVDTDLQCSVSARADLSHGSRHDLLHAFEVGRARDCGLDVVVSILELKATVESFRYMNKSNLGGASKSMGSSASLSV